MNRNKLLSVFLVVVMMASIPVMVSAAPAASSVGTGTILSIALNTDATTKVTAVDVALVDGAGLAEKINISLDTAVKMGLVIPATNNTLIGTNVTFSPTQSGIVNSLDLGIDPITGITTLSVTYTDITNVVQVVSLDLSDALSLALITAPVDA